MNKKSSYYITTTLPYVNAAPHIGFALEIVQADVVARYRRLLGNEVFFNFGTDEHGQKIYQKAIEGKQDPKKYVDEYANKFDNLKNALNLSYDNFIRTTDPHHMRAAQDLWGICENNGFIEKGIYKTKYCVGCELEKTESELVNGCCEYHPTLKIQEVDEENYFFKFSKFQDRLLKLYKDNPKFVIPAHRQKEITNFVESGLQDFSVSRLKRKMPWGIPVPGDPKHVMYVWFDALTNYISALGWPENKNKFEKFWGTIKHPKAVQVAGKDNLRQQASMWQAMLLAAELPPSKQIFIHGFISANGQRISKTLGNIVDPYVLVNKYGTDAVRYYLLKNIHPWEDSDFTVEKFEQVYQANLANGLGNLISRVAGLSEKVLLKSQRTNPMFSEGVVGNIEAYRFDHAITEIWKQIAKLDLLINEKKAWELNGKEKYKVLQTLVNGVRQIAFDLQPFLPGAAKEITRRFSGKTVVQGKPLFPRLD